MPATRQTPPKQWTKKEIKKLVAALKKPPPSVLETRRRIREWFDRELPPATNG